MKVIDICTTDVVTAEPDESISAVALRMREAHVGDVVVVDDSPDGPIPTGMVTDRDIVISLIAEGSRDLDQSLVAEAMSQTLLVVDHQEDIDRVLDQMSEYGVRRVPVVDDRGALVGILSMDDCLGFMRERLDRLARLVDTGIQHETDRDRPDAPSPHRPRP